MKKLTALLLVAVLALSLFGCAAKTQTATAPATTTDSATTEEAAPAGGVQITVVTSYGGDDGNRANYEAAVASYEAATGNTVADASATSNEEWKAKVMTDFETGTEPDVLFYFTGSDADSIVSGDKVVSIEEIRAEYPEYASNMKDDLMPKSTYDGEAYAVPVNGFWEGMFVNKNVLDAAGVEVPGADYTWEQFLIDCEAIKEAGFAPVAVSLAEVPHYWFDFAVFNNGSVENHLDLAVSADDEVGQKWADGMDDIKELYELGYLPSNTMTATDAETVQMFGEDMAAFLIDGSWKLGYFTENYPDDLEKFALAYVPAKGDREATELLGGISMGYYITRQAWEDVARREAALDFISHMTSDTNVSLFSKTAVTALNSGVILTEELTSIEESAIAMCAGATAIVGPVQDLMTAEAREDLFANVKNVAVGKISATDAVASSLSK
ncbi:MAG: extracellular solute-binding protein [Eubacteriales bacterium]